MKDIIPIATPPATEELVPVHGTIADLAQNDRIAEGERPYEVTIEEVPYFVWGKSKTHARTRVLTHFREVATMRAITMSDMFQALRDKGE